MAAEKKPSDEAMMALIAAQQSTISELVALANEQIKVIGQLVSEPTQRAAVVTRLQARLAATQAK